MKKYILILAVMSMMILPITCEVEAGDTTRVYTVEFHNTSAKHTVIYFLYHVDHGFPILRDVIPVAGEIKPLGETSTVRVGGIYYVVWKEQHTGNILKATDGFILDKHMEFYYP
ncbi:MAG: hypothetical protein KAT35_05500 [Candidatus Aenigmarchaeota archaeon]|nr:hypothetical protein [Candidatus Aenigmarchaeota archaeon]